MQNVGKESKISLKKEAFNCVENLLIRDEIEEDEYEILIKLIKILNNDNILNLGEGIVIKLIDCNDV